MRHWISFRRVSVAPTRAGPCRRLPLAARTPMLCKDGPGVQPSHAAGSAPPALLGPLGTSGCLERSTCAELGPPGSWRSRTDVQKGRPRALRRCTSPLRPTRTRVLASRPRRVTASQRADELAVTGDAPPLLLLERHRSGGRACTTRQPESGEPRQETAPTWSGAASSPRAPARTRLPETAASESYGGHPRRSMQNRCSMMGWHGDRVA